MVEFPIRFVKYGYINYWLVVSTILKNISQWDGLSHVFEGSLEVKLPTIWRDEKAVSREKSQKRKDQKKEDADARKGRKVAKHCVFPMIWGPGGSKNRLAKAAGAEASGFWKLRC